MNYRSMTEHLFYAFLFALLIYIIIFVRVVNFEFHDPFVYFYTIFTTTFMLSRVAGSFFYRSHKDRLSDKQKAALKNYNPSITYVIPCKNEEKAIYHTMKRCLEADYPEEKTELIVINDGSTDGTLKEMQRAKKEFSDRKVTIIDFEKNKGKRHAMAAGFRAAKGELIVHMDSDSYPAKHGVREIILPFIDKEVGATVGHTDPSNRDTNTLTRMQSGYYFMSFRALKASESIFDMVFCCSGCFAAYRKNDVIPFLDEWLNEEFLGKKVTFGDDRSLTNWILKSGFKTVYVDEAQAYTIVPDTSSKFLKQQVRWKKSWFINSLKITPYILRHEPLVAVTYFIPLFLITLLTPFVALKALLINPLFLGIDPWFYIGGVMLVSLMLFAHYHLYSEDKYGKYILLWSFLNMTLLSYIMVYALYDMRNMGWGTR